MTAGWRDLAACRGVDPDLFFPERGESTEPAKAVCAVCPVRVKCLAAHIGESVGVFGGLSARQRKSLRSERWRAARAGVAA